MSFSFVNYVGPKLPQDPSVRRIMRQRAMTDVAAARKERRGYGQHNLFQHPLVVELPRIEELPLPEKDNSAPCLSVDGIISGGPRLGSPKRGGHYSLSRRQGISYILRPSPVIATPKDFLLLLNRMPLTGLRLGIATLSHLASEPAQKKKPLLVTCLGSRKLISFIPSRYGQVSSLRHATDCVITQLRHIVLSSDSGSAYEEMAALLHYTKALEALQTAIDDETQRMTPETLCATELLGVFEALRGNSGTHAWVHHVGGAARLIEARGAHRFKTEFEMALFMAHVGPIVMDAVLSNTSCFLTEERWQQVMRSAIYNDESFSDQKDLVFTLWSHLVRIPKYFKDTTDIVLAPYRVPQARIDDLIGRLWNGLDALSWWLSQAQPGSRSQERGSEGAHALRWPAIENLNLGSGYINQLALCGTYTLCCILKARLLFALAPSQFHHLEVECQAQAGRIIGLPQASGEDGGRKLIWSLFMSQSSWIASGVLETKDAWSEGWEDQRGVIEE